MQQWRNLKFSIKLLVSLGYNTVTLCMLKMEAFKFSSQIKINSKWYFRYFDEKLCMFYAALTQFLIYQRCLCWKCTTVSEKLEQWADREEEKAQELSVLKSAMKQQIVHDKLSFEASGLISQDLSHLLHLEYCSSTLQTQENRTRGQDKSRFRDLPSLEKAIAFSLKENNKVVMQKSSMFNKALRSFKWQYPF